MPPRPALLGALLLAWLLPWLAAAPPLHAEPRTFVVTKTDDTNDGACDADCSLREAVIAANATPNAPDPENEQEDPPVVSDVIDLPAGTYTLTLAGSGEDAAATGDLDITESVVIRPPPDSDDDATTVRIEGSCAAGADDRVFHVLELPEEDLFEALIARVTIACGGDLDAFDDNGGGILVEGGLFLAEVILRDNEVDDARGGAVYVAPTGLLVVERAAFLENASDGGDGGALANDGNLSLGNATFALNTAGGNGGAIHNGAVDPDGAPLVTNVTISGNSAAGEGDGIYHEGSGTNGELEFRSSLLADACAAAMDSEFVSVGGNIESPGATCNLDEDESNHPAAPLLEPLDGSGLPIYPLTPDPDNPAIDGGVNSACFPQDQRSRPRPVDGDFDGSPDCDAGAYEAQLPLAEKTDELVVDVDGDDVADEGDTLRYTIELTNEGETTFDGPFNLTDFPVDTTIVPGSESLVSGAGTIEIEDVLDDEEEVIGTQISVTEATFPATVIFDVTIDEGLDSSIVFVSNQANVTLLHDDPDDDPDMGLVPLTSFFSDDPDTPEFGDPTLTEIAEPPALTFTKRDELPPEGDLVGDGLVNPGDTVRYTIELENTGERTARNVELLDEIHRDGTLDMDSVETMGIAPTSMNVSPSTIRLDFESLAEGESVTLTFDVMVNDPILLGCTDFENQAVVSGDNVVSQGSEDVDSGGPTVTEIDFGPLADLDTRLKIKLDFDEAGNDKAKLKVKRIPLPVTSPGGLEVMLDLGGNLVMGTLDSDGRYEADGGNTRIRLKQKGDGEFKLLVKLKKAALAEALAPVGLVDADVDKERLSVPVQLGIGTESFRASLPVRYDAKAGKKGKAKSATFTLPAFDCPLLDLF